MDLGVERMDMGVGRMDLWVRTGANLRVETEIDPGGCIGDGFSGLQRGWFLKVARDTDLRGG